MMFFYRHLFLLVTILALLIVIAPASAQSDEQPVTRVVLFYSPTCPHCIDVMENVLPPLQETYGEQLDIQYLNLTEPLGYQVYTALHERFPDLPGGVPQMYVDDHVLLGSDQIRVGLPQIIEECLADGGCDWPFRYGTQPDSQDAPEATEPAEPAEPAPAEAAPVYLAYCYDPACLECAQLTFDLEALQRQYPNLVVQAFNVHDDAAAIEAMCERFGVPSEDRLLAPAVIVGETYLALDEITVPRLNELVANANELSASAPWEGLDNAAIESASASIGARFGSLSLLVVAGAGLLDGVNPCAFTTIIFFISYLGLMGRGKREILLVGAAFTAAVFLTYLAMGMGLAAVVERIGSIGVIGQVIYAGTALICLIFAALSLWDFVKIQRGHLNEIALQLPKFLKQRIHQTIRTHSRMRNYVTAAFGAGVLVSVFELACTGQVYLPTIVYMTSMAETDVAVKLTALAYLVVYNALFVVPLIAVFGVAYFGTSSQRLTTLFQTNAAAVKLFTAALFGLLGVWMAYLLLA